MDSRNKKVNYGKSKKVGSLGVFAQFDIKKRQLIEKCPLILLPMEEFKEIKKTKLFYYYFDYSKKYFCIALGYGSLYNHSYHPNAKYVFDYLNQLINIYAIEDIKKGNEIFVNYNYLPDDKTPLESWFDPQFKDLS